ncbi:TRAP transporter TAXI family solute receptor [Paraburkholderia atlantica]|uniref:TRAP transporter TAXI family solute receptor n=1 Tax=Paraburkholderia atlantica TaxID=2654982 RepID=A0A6I1Q4M2_PARAM|nr:TAXI family TRAP transporter solute-binding subunit [Paraburkholderia atlantica]MBB5418880.1 TRAP transporter TAXI family solute receptor [Paraburkholderia atlantica]MBB5422893.1 TRAP transporter TAXI family solute receptor [Paraburkholderia atlantica]MPW09121.1 TAXI family TRAP transporter solute-binding subunit [Paraburkholderia atlantica]NUY30286.1 TAXI family TRAP transporter solute-binding subunit [Paraburkholderia atlantica]
MTRRRRRLLIIGAIVLVAAFGWMLALILEPAFQRTIVITTGADGGIYRGFADRYAPLLKREGIKLDIRSSSGSVENYQRLADPDSAYQVGFIQSGTTRPKDTDNLQTIAAVSYEPIWVFYRGDATIDRLSQLRGKRISIGVPGSGLLNVSQVLLGYSGVTSQNSTLLQMDATAAYQGLESGQIDAAFFIGRPDADMQHTLLTSNLKLMSFAQADALAQKFPSLSKIVLPRASTSVSDDLPRNDVTLLAATALLVSKDTLHPALVYLLLDAARTVHGGEDYFTPLGTFPNLNTEEFPISDESVRYFKSGRPFLYRYLPFWLASLIERRLLILVPFLALLIGLAQALPRMLEARMKKRLFVWYRAIKALEDEVWKNAEPSRAQIAQWSEEIENIDANANQIRIPYRYFQDVYALKQAIGVVRDRIAHVAQKMEK